MAKTRMINTRFWVDDYISNLDPVEKLLFLYLLTNPSTDISGVYELPTKNMALDTGIDRDMVLKILQRFTKDKKIYYHKGWVGVANFIKHQSLNPKVLEGVKNGLSKAPIELVNRLHIASDSLSHLNLNSNSNLNSNLKDIEPIGSNEPTPKETASKFFEIVKVKSPEFEEIINNLSATHGGQHDFFRSEILKFYNHWTERNPSGKKQKWEMQKTFEVKRRLSTWFQNADKWSKNKNYQAKKGIEV